MGDENSDIRAAERALEQALAAEDPLAWVDHYCDDAVFVVPNAPMVRGRTALEQMARSMQPLSSVSIVPLQTERDGTTAAVLVRGSWVSGAASSQPQTVRVRGILVWRDVGGTWRVAQELLHPDPED